MSSEAPGRELLRSGSLYTIATAIQLAAGFLILPLLTRTLSVAEYGVVTAALVVQALLGIIAGLGIRSAITRSYYRPEEGPETARGLILVTAGVALGVTFLADLSGPIWVQVFEGLEYEGAVRTAVWIAIPTAVVAAAQSFLRAARRPLAFVGTVAFSAVVAQGLGVIAADGGGADAYMLGLGGGWALAAAFGLTVSSIWKARLPARRLISTNLAIALPTIPHLLAMYTMSAGDRVVVERLEGIADVGRYHVAYLIGSLSIVLLSALNNAWGPIVFGAPEERRWSTLAETTKPVLRIALLLAVGLALTAPLALELIVPDTYETSGLAMVAALAALSAIPFAWYLANVHIVIWQGSTLALAIITPLCAGLNVALNFLLLPPLGLAGAALASLLSYGLLSLLVGLFARRLAPVRWPRRDLAAVVALAVALGGFATLVPEDGGWLVGRLLLAVVAAVPLVMLLSRGAGLRSAAEE